MLVTIILLWVLAKACVAGKNDELSLYRAVYEEHIISQDLIILVHISGFQDAAFHASVAESGKAAGLLFTNMPSTVSWTKGLAKAPPSSLFAVHRASIKRPPQLYSVHYDGETNRFVIAFNGYCFAGYDRAKRTIVNGSKLDCELSDTLIRHFLAGMIAADPLVIYKKTE